MSVSTPAKKLSVPFANESTLKNDVPLDPVDPLASYRGGFPRVNMLPVTAGGIPPEGQDFNGILFDMSAHTVWLNAGGMYKFDATLLAEIGSYPVGAVLQDTAGVSSYVNILVGQTGNFNTDPTLIGVSWMPFSGVALNNSASTLDVAFESAGNITLDYEHYSVKVLTIFGVLTTNVTLTFPNSIREIVVINACTGAFSLSVKTAAQSGSLPIIADGTESFVCDGTNMTYAQNEAITAAPLSANKRIANAKYVDDADYALLNNTHLRGIPEAPDPSPGNNSDQVPNTRFVNSAVAASSVNIGLYMLGKLM